MEKYYIAVLSATDNLGNQSIKHLINFFGSAEAAWHAERVDLEKSKLRSRAVDSLIKFRQENPEAVEKLIDFCDEKNIGVCSIVDKDYPPILKEISTPPAVFYYRGILEPLAERIAIVGTRNYTRYGEKVAFSISRDLAEAGLTVVSGAARGIDTFAHRGAMKTGRTVAVIGGGIALTFSRERRNFFDEIADSGIVMTEFKPSMVPNKNTFPTRNRIIAGLSRGVVVVEAAKKSGALITSSFAGEYGRDVFSIPGNVDARMSVGCNELIRDGATLIKNAQDVLEFYNLEAKIQHENNFESAKKIELDENEKRILDAIPLGEPITLDEILMKVDDIPVDEISGIMLQLEIKKCVTEDAGNYFRQR